MTEYGTEHHGDQANQQSDEFSIPAAGGTGSGFGGGQIPPETPPTSQGPSGEDPPVDPFQIIRLMIAQGMEQYSAVYDQRSEALQGQIQEIVGAVQKMGQAINNLEVRGNEQFVNADNDNPAPMPFSGDPKTAIGLTLMDLINNPQKIADLVGSVAQAKNMWKPAPDALSVLNYYKQTQPDLFSIFVPDPTGGRLPSMLEKTLNLGMGIGTRAKVAQTSNQGSAPLVSETSGNSEVSSSQSTIQAQHAQNAPDLSTMTVEEIDQGITTLMGLRITLENQGQS